MHHPTDRIAHTTAFVTPVVEHWLEREILIVIKDALAICFSANSVYVSIKMGSSRCALCSPTDNCKHTYFVYISNTQYRFSSVCM